MTRERKFSKEQARDYFRMLNLRSVTTSVTTGNKTVETVEEAIHLGREKAKESAQKLKLRIKI